MLFLQHVIRSLRDGGRCGIVLDEGVLFRTNEDAFVKTKRKLLDDCDLWCIVSLPGGVFTAAGAGVKTNLLFFTKGQPTRKIWYYDLSDVKVGKKTPLTLKHFEEFFRLLPERADSELSWTVDMDERKRVAADEARPFKEQSAAKGQQAAQWNERLKDLKKAQPRDDRSRRGQPKPRSRTLTREARDLAAKAKEIEDAVYDLKAVNPHRKPDVDDRTPKTSWTSSRPRGERSPRRWLRCEGTEDCNEAFENHRRSRCNAERRTFHYERKRLTRTAAMAGLLAQAKKSSGTPSRFSGSTTAILVPGCGFSVDVMQHKGQNALSLNTFIYRPRGMFIGYFLCSLRAQQIFKAAERNPGVQIPLHGVIERNLITAYQRYLASQDA